MTEKLTDHERRCRELDRAFARYGMGRSEAEIFPVAAELRRTTDRAMAGQWAARAPGGPRRPDRNQMGNPRSDRETQE